MKRQNYRFNHLKNKKTILVAPIHWGLGHATRCIPVIKALLENRYNVVIASDGGALQLLRKEFPNLKSIELPSYNITYPKKGTHFKWNMLLKLPRFLKVISSEKKLIEKLVSEGKIDGIISDNRFGVRSNKIPSVYITHQLNVFSGSTSNFSSKIHQNIIRKFDECWVPDLEGKENLSGKLGHIKNTFFPLRYLGVLSRMKKVDLPIKYDILITLSGPEPQRTLLEEKLIQELNGENKKVLLVQGLVNSNQEVKQQENITLCNYMTSTELEQAINESEVVVSRSGYTTIMDLATLEKKAYFIPTPGQYEQEYLAKRLKKLKLAPFCKQEDFTIDKLKEVDLYEGLKSNLQTTNYNELFCLF